MLIPLVALAWALAARPSPRLLVGAAVMALALQVPAGIVLTELGGIECPRGCSTGQDLLQGVFFLALPLTVIVLLMAAVVTRVRRR